MQAYGGCGEGGLDLRFSGSTSTLIAGTEIVPWLVAAGKLAYSPESPPERDYFFQYSWVVPGILQESTNKRCHHWFGDPLKHHPLVRLLLRLWNAASQGAHDPVFVSNGVAGPDADVTAPVAAYRHADVHRSGHASTRVSRTRRYIRFSRARRSRIRSSSLSK